VTVDHGEGAGDGPAAQTGLAPLEGGLGSPLGRLFIGH
jgi:hypothetical protein